MVWVSFDIFYILVVFAFAYILRKDKKTKIMMIPLLAIPITSLIAPTELGTKLGFWFYFILGLIIYLSHRLIRVHNISIWVKIILMSCILLCSLTGLEVLLYELWLIDMANFREHIYSQAMTFLMLSLLLNFIVGGEIGVHSRKSRHNSGDVRAIFAGFGGVGRAKSHHKIEE